MPNALIKSFAERSGKSVEEVEKIWDGVKKRAKDKFKDENGKFWAYVNRSVQFALGLAHKKMSFKQSVDKEK
jgi:hypothetical protein